VNTQRNRGFVSAREQATLGAAHVAIAGVGGDGGQVAETLARLGVSSFALADPEDFEAENLNRQNTAFVDTIGRNKALVLSETVARVNPRARVDTYPEGVTSQNVARFVRSADLVIDETEYTRPEIAVRLARECRRQSVPLLTGLNVGFGCLVTSFLPAGGRTLERHLGLGEDAPLEAIAQATVPLGRWVPRLPDYVHETTLRLVEGGKIPAPSVAPGVAFVAGVVSIEAFNHLVGRRDPVLAPRCIWMDGLERRSRVIRFPVASFYGSLARVLWRSRLGLNERPTV
jgi:tRNA threonylcarbamoyladenosine dehydratase